jgi:hypothetical protein
MKKFFLSMSAVALLLTSCNKDDSNNSTASELKLVTTSNSSGKVSVTDLTTTSPTVKSFTIPSMDADGAYYSGSTDEIIVASRSNNKLEVYGGVENAMTTNSLSLTLGLSTGADFSNPREIAVFGDKVVVTQDQSTLNGNVNRLFVYQKSSTALTLINTYTVDFKVWGITLNQNTLYAVADLTADVAVFDNFFANANGNITPTKRVTIQGIVRTHGITYSAADNTLVLTDIGDATVDSDGGIVVINNFTSVLSSTANSGTIATTSQIRISGSQTKLGNPVDVAYDNVTNKIYVAERLNAGGQVLVFVKPTANGNTAPIDSRTETAVSSVFLFRG